MIPCLGSLSNDFLLARTLRAEEPLTILTGECETCPMRAGAEHYREREKEILALFDYLRIAIPPVHVATPSAAERELVIRQYETHRVSMEKAQALSRREFFSHMRESLARRAPEPGKTDARTADSRSAHRGLFPERRSLVELFRKYGEGANRDRGVVPLCREIQVGENCIGCGACANICPTGALAFEERPDEVHVNWRPAHCSSCDLCLDACVRKALHVLPCRDAGRIAGEATSTVKVFQRQQCRVCGSAFLSSGPDACSPETRGPGTSCPDCSRTEQFMDAVSAMIYGEERMVPSR